MERNASPLEPVGSQGQPAVTLAAMQSALKGMELRQGEVIVVSDWQDDRRAGRYAVLVRGGGRHVLSEDAFGPRYGRAGEESMRALVRYLLDHGAVNFKERVLPPHEFNRTLSEVTPAVMQGLNAGGNAADPQIYLE